MREPIRDKERLEHILEAIDDILQNKDVFTFSQVKDNPILYYGFVKEVEIIGEAVYMLSNDFKNAHPQCEWDVIEGMRHVLVHGYYTIDPDQLWDTVQNDIPPLKPIIISLLEEIAK